MTDAAEVNETHPQQEQTKEKTERTVIKIKKKKKKLKDKKFTSQRSSQTEIENETPAHDHPRSMEERNEDIDKMNEQPTIREYERNEKDKSMNNKKTKKGTDTTEGTERKTKDQGQPNEDSPTATRDTANEKDHQQYKTVNTPRKKNVDSLTTPTYAEKVKENKGPILPQFKAH